MSETKDRIIEVALNLFAQRGYSAVSIRDICAGVGIKESSVYYHFSSKKDILMQIVTRFQEISEGMMHQLDEGMGQSFAIIKNHTPNSVDRPSNPAMNPDGFGAGVAHNFFESYFLDDFINKVMRLLSIEQFNDEEIHAVYITWLFDKPLEYQSRILSQLIQFGVLKESDPDDLAMKYYSPIFMLAKRYILSGVLTEENRQEFLRRAYAHSQNFFAEMMQN